MKKAQAKVVKCSSKTNVGSLEPPSWSLKYMFHLVDFVIRKYSDDELDGNLIDHLYSNNPYIISQVFPHSGITGSDHGGIFFTLNVAVPRPTLPPGNFLQYFKADTDGLRNDLANTNWHKMFWWQINWWRLVCFAGLLCDLCQQVRAYKES